MIRDEAYNLIDRLDNDVLTDVLNYALRINPSIFAAVVAQNMSDIIPFFTEDDKTDMEFLAKRFLSNSRKPIKSADKHFNYDEYLGDIYDLDERNADSWSREEYNEMVEIARGIFYPAVQKAANVCHFTVSDDEAEYVAEKCVRCFFDNTSWEEAVNRPEEYQVNSSRKPIKSSLEDRLVPYLEEFEEGYSEALVKDSQNGDDFDHVYEDTFYEMFKSDYNLTDKDIQKLEKAVREIWDASSTEEGEVRDMGEMYGAPRGATPEEALKVFESRKSIKSGSMSGWFGGICDKCKQYTNVHYVGYKGRKLCMRCSRGR